MGINLLHKTPQVLMSYLLFILLTILHRTSRMLVTEKHIFQLHIVTSGAIAIQHTNGMSLDTSPFFSLERTTPKHIMIVRISVTMTKTTNATLTTLTATTKPDEEYKINEQVIQSKALLILIPVFPETAVVG